jgi:hypothetical protein|tara:strand:+ start:713 stop:850 length:138 start_codon:yes stop_codon:yes gene_type:complete
MLKDSFFSLWILLLEIKNKSLIFYSVPKKIAEIVYLTAAKFDDTK